MIDVELECHLLLDSFSRRKIASDGFKKVWRLAHNNTNM